MGLIVLIFSCAVGFLAGLMRVLVFDASIWGGVVSYFTVSCTLAVLALTCMVLADMMRAREPRDLPRDRWSDGIAEEA